MDVDTNEEKIEIKVGNDAAFNDLPWVEKYRPKSLDELVAHEEIVNICT